MATPKYSRDETIAAITDFYKFLVFMWRPDDCIKYPPPEGWPITSNLVPQPSKAALDLIRHMPYIEYRDWDYDQIYWKTSGVDYTYCTEPGPHNIGLEREWKQVIPPHVVILAEHSERSGLHFLLDTERGTITMYDWMSGLCSDYQAAWKDKEVPRPDPDEPAVYQSSEELNEEWRLHPTYAAKEFFEMIKQEYRSVKYAPEPLGEVLAVSDDPAGEEIKEIFREHGWPGGGYQKTECLRELGEFHGNEFNHWDE